MLFVSHDLKSVRNFCDKTVLLKQGEMVAIGATNEIIDKYVYGLKTDVKPETVVENAGQGVSRSTDLGSASVDDTSKVCNDKVELSDIKLIDKYGNENNRFNSGDPLLIKGSYHMNKSIPDPVFGIEICDDKGNYCFGANNKARDIKLGTLSGEGGICINMPDLPLLSGKYYITIAVTSWDLKTIYDWHDKKYSFEVINTTNDVGFIKFTCDFGVS
jgi:lipopolysaccharide transport system ATP-binding protein